MIHNDVIIASRHNERELRNDPTAHAEIAALRDAARNLNRVAKIINCMTQARQINVDTIALPLRNFARSLKRHANASEQLGLARIETLTKNGFDANDPSLATLFVAQEQLVQDINMLERLSAALNNTQAKQSKQTKQLIAVMQTLSAGLDDQSFSDLFRERLESPIPLRKRLKTLKILFVGPLPNALLTRLMPRLLSGPVPAWIGRPHAMRCVCLSATVTARWRQTT